jgi:hypothetical protein
MMTLCPTRTYSCPNHTAPYIVQQSDLVWEDFSWRLGSPPPHTERQDSQGPSRLGLSFLFARLVVSVTVKSRHAFVRFAHGAARRPLTKITWDMRGALRARETGIE